ncbi:MAG: hypothetical protein QW735_02755 [archaeon]
MKNIYLLAGLAILVIAVIGIFLLMPAKQPLTQQSQQQGPSTHGANQSPTFSSEQEALDYLSSILENSSTQEGENILSNIS